MSTDTKNKELTEERITVPEGVEIAFSDNILTLKGALGEVRRDFNKVKVNLSLDNRCFKIVPFSSRKRHMAIMNTARSIVRNMITGVTEGFTYKLKIAFAHFPITVKVKGKEVHVENFYGERAPRVAEIVGDCQVQTHEDDVVVKGVSLDDVAQTSANIEQMTTVKRKDQRVFLDGVYIYEKRRGK